MNKTRNGECNPFGYKNKRPVKFQEIKDYS